MGGIEVPQSGFDGRNAQGVLYTVCLEAETPTAQEVESSGN